MKKELVLLFGFALAFLIVLSQNTLAETYDVFNCRIIDSPGLWILKNNITDDISSPYCFRIIASNVIFDLNGFTITHNKATAITIQIYLDVFNVTVKNGVIRSGGTEAGIRIESGAENITLTNLDIEKIPGTTLENGIVIVTSYWARNITIKDVKARLAKYNFRCYGYCQYAVIKNSDFRYSDIYDIYIQSSTCQDFISCGLEFNETKVVNYGYNVSLSKEDCAIVMPEYPIKVWVIDGLKKEALLENCYQFTNATVCVDGRCLNQTNAYWHEERCYIPGKANFLYYPPIYEFIVTEKKFYTINATYPGYKPQNRTVYVDGLTPIFFYLYGIDTYDLTVMVKDYHTLEPIGGAEILLYYENGTLYEHPLYGTMHQYTDYFGYVRLPGLTPNLNYYFTLSKFGYELYKSPIFNLTQDLTFEVSMTQAVELLILTATPTQNVYANTTVFWTVNNTLGTPAGSTSIYCQRGAEPEFEVISFYAHINPYTVGASIGKDGTIRCWAYSHTYDMTSNDVWFNVGTAVPYYPELGVYSIIFHPIFIGTMLLISISAYIEYKLRTNGKAFLVAIIILTFVLSIVGFYPAWVGVLIIMAVGFILVYLFREIFWG
jgi:hypothetical protein